MENTFGAFISSKRLEKQISLRNFADVIGVSPVYASHIERNMRSAPSVSVLKRISNILVLNSDEEEMMYDLAAKSKSQPTIAADLIEYINAYPTVTKVLRFAKRNNVDEKEWQIILKLLIEKNLKM